MLFTQFLKKGYQPLPIGYMTKYPCTFNNGTWSNYSRLGKLSDNPVTEKDTNEWDAWLEHGAGVGIALGKHSGIIALDFDKDDEITKAIKSILPKPKVMKIGAKGVTAFFKYNGEKNKKWKVKGEKDYTLELLSTGNQTVIPPSIHPSTQQPYTWVGDVSLLDVSKDELGTLPSNFTDLVDQLTGNVKEERLPTVQKELETTPDDIKEALSYIHPDCPYEQWVEIGMALKDEMGDAGYEVWDNWSKSGFKYPKNGEPSLMTKWRSFKHTGVKIGTLFHHAKLEGYVPTMPEQEHKFYDIPFLKKIKLEPAPQGAKERLEYGFPRHLLNAPNVLGDIQKWITESGMFPQPVLALSASISAMGALYAHKIEGETGSRTNMYCLGVALSGSGKEHPRKCVNTLLSSLGHKELIGGQLVSSAGLLKSIRDGKGKRIIQVDEFGRILKSMNSKNASAHYAGITTMLMELFSKADDVYYGAEYANHDGKQDRQDIDQPCLCVHASTVPDHLFQAMTGSDAVDGFLSRWLIFDEREYPDAQTRKGTSREVPVYILERLKATLKRYEKTGNLQGMVIAPKVIPFSEEAKVMADEFCKAMRQRTKEKHEQGENTYAIWTRTFEHATKLALIAHEGDEISADVMKWAIELSTYCSQYLCDQAQAHISDNEHEKNLKYVLNVIRGFGKNGISKSDLIKKTQKLNTRERGDILTTLLESEQIEAIQVAGVTRPTTKYIIS